MSAFSHPVFRASALALLLGSTMLSGAARAEPAPMEGPAPAGEMAEHPEHHKGPPSPEMMKAHVEERIKMLHQKLMITQEQDASFNAVAETMRENEAMMGSLIQDHEANRGKQNAVDSLNSYARIAQAHVDGLKKVADSFDTLYGEMSPEQKATADKVFSEGPMMGHPMHHKHGMHHKKTK